MRTAIVGAGVCGLGLAHGLSAAGHTVDLYDGAATAGGLVAPHDFGPFVWDRFYHCIMPQDEATLRFLERIGLRNEIRWKRVRTGFFGNGALYSLSGGLDLLRFPLLSLADKARLALFVRHVRGLRDTGDLRNKTAAAWLIERCGARVYDVFWRPLLKSKFGPYHDRVAALLLYYTVRRSFDARSGDAAPEQLGHVPGGYARILARSADVLARQGATFFPSSPVTGIAARPDGAGCDVSFIQNGRPSVRTYDQCFFCSALPPKAETFFQGTGDLIDRYRRLHPNARRYLDIVCGVLVLRRPLSPFYVINLGDESIPLTGVVEMTNLVDAADNTAGRSLVYLPKYVEADAPEKRMTPGELYERFVENGLRRIFPDLRREDVESWTVHTGVNVQPLAFPGELTADAVGVPTIERPVQILNSAMAGFSNLHVSSVLSFVESFLSRSLSGI